ncbi:hypothetical protein ACTXT7_007596 [Hymenolepis weldensis]
MTHINCLCIPTETQPDVRLSSIDSTLPPALLSPTSLLLARIPLMVGLRNLCILLFETLVYCQPLVVTPTSVLVIP